MLERGNMFRVVIHVVEQNKRADELSFQLSCTNPVVEIFQRK